ncbi:dynein axonemal heavy chain 2 isoform X2 [Episyrphus balteatus]|uniref:dynein axonemal heavy chain 2 isoform X2 n=1 Tax=Episyrphus balteatus TaxID=286459 RepID=UPI0024866F76|nr:dynein axonemal heavy chain 2 isoform X2 [Episyrphus balteatus]
MAGHVSIMSSVSESAQDENEIKEQIQTVPETPVPTYSDEELAQLVTFVQRMTVLYGLDHRDWTEVALSVIRSWFLGVNELVLTIFYDQNKLIACLSFPIVPVQGLTYFMRKPNEIFDVETFHDEVIYGTLHENIDKAFLRTLTLIYAPYFRDYTDWSDNVRYRFFNALDKVLANVTGLHYKISGATVLYVPTIKNKSNPSVAARDRELVKSLEAIAVHWGTQIRTCLTDKVLVAPHELVCPIEEYEFWVYRYEVLQCLSIQLHSDDIQNVVQILRIAQSVYIKQMEELIQECDSELIESKSNVKYLQLLVKPSQMLENAKSPAEIPTMLPRFIHLIRFIWLNSEYYNKPELITGLFRNLSNQIIQFCTSQTNIDKILDGHPRFGIQMCNMSIECCLSYKAIFKEILKQYEGNDKTLGRGLDEAMIFNHVNAFEERLHDLIDICQSMIVFGRLDETEVIPKPLFGGTRGSYFERKSENVESNFMKILETLRKDSKDLILDVHRNEWYAEVLKYRKMIRSLEEIVQRLMSSVFQSICNVEEGLEVLVTLHFYSFRDALRRTYLKQVSEVWAMFITDIAATNEKLKEQSQYHESWVPKYASKAMMYKTNLERLTWIKDRLEYSEWLPDVSFSKVALTKFIACNEDYRKEMQKSFKSWTQVADVDFVPKLNRTLLIRSKAKRGLLECNIDRSLLQICEEARYFAQMGFHIPPNINKQYSKYSSMKFVYNSVITVCLSYNRILATLSPGERKLFAMLIQGCDKKIAPGIFKLSWGGEFSDEYIVDCSKHTEKLQGTVDIYKRANFNISRACEKICNLTFFNILNTGQSLESFEKNLDAQCKATAKILSKQYSFILELILAVFREFQNVYDEMVPQWTYYINRLDDMLEAAFLICVKNSLTNVFDVLHGRTNVGPSQILLVNIDIQDRKIVFLPATRDISLAFQTLLSRITNVLKDFPRLWQKFKLSTYSRTFDDIVRNNSDCIALEKNIMHEVEYNISELNAFLVNWTKFQPIWEMQELTFLKNWEEREQTAEAFDESLSNYTSFANEVSIQETISTVHFITINSSKLKNSILDFIDCWQDFNVKLLKKKAYARIKGIYKYMNYNIEKVSIIPRTLKEIKESTKFYEQLVKEIEPKSNEFPAILELFKVLANYQIKFPSNSLELVQNLDQEWQNYIKKLLEADEMLGNTKEEFKASLLAQSEKFKVAIKTLMEEFLLKVPTSSQIPSKIALKYLDLIRQKVEACFKFEKSLSADLKIFGIGYFENVELKKIESEEKILRHIWELVNEWTISWNEWKDGNFWKINLDVIEDTAISLYTQFNQLCKSYNDRNWEFLETIRKNVGEFRKTLPLIAALRNPSMRPRHWDKLRAVVEMEFDQYAKDFTLDKIIAMNFQAFSEEIQDISNAATMELQIENAIKNIATIWAIQKFEVAHYRDGIYRIKNVEDCVQLLEEHLIQISSMKSTKFVEPFIKTVDYWEKTLANVSETLEKALTVQRQWLYLENIFAGEDISKQLPLENKRFRELTIEWGSITEKMFHAKSAVKAIHHRIHGFLLQRCTNIEDELEKIQRALEIYLESKRQLFPRFYFISNDDLLEILGNAKKPDLIQTHLKKLFDNLYKLELKKILGKQIRWQSLGMYANDGEYVEFPNIIYIEGPAEKWLATIETQMLAVLKNKLKLTRASLKQLMTNREKWLKSWPGQLCLTTALMQWTAECTRSLVHCKIVNSKKPLRKLKRKQNKVLGILSDLSRKELPTLLRIKVNTLITIEIHGRDVIERMYKMNCRDVSHFEWFSQLRFYWDRDLSTCNIKQTNTQYTYGYEYTGNSGRLVITPLTDRCYITLTTALHLHRGGSPKGPAGTGKTETVKDLGKALGLWVVVTNCSEGLDYKSIGKNFSGLAQTGAWGCFDEFNRINIEVLSVVAQQILSIMTALSAKQKMFNFEGQMIRLRPTVGLFITMNPGYAGRTELPDNLKSMFRPIAMMVPDNIIIAENLLFSDGFQNARILARKVFTLYELAKQQLSKQCHYDFGLRSMVALLRYAGKKRRQLPGTYEDEIVYLSMRDMNVARLTAEDLPLFNGIMEDIFPGLFIPTVDYTDFIEAISAEFKSNGLQLIPNAIKKVIEVHETKSSRHSTMIIGDTCTAKSVTWKALQGACNRLNNLKKEGWESVTVYPMNPKALNLAELYGEYNLATGEWLDGVLSLIMRTVCAEETPSQKWILFDGPVDAVWIENMNSVMDDNKVLTLVNSERITMPPQVSLLFEASDLAVASPATVSRCGIVYNDYNDWGWRPYVQSWLDRQPLKEFVNILRGLFDDYIDKILDFKKTRCRETIVTNELNMVMSMCKLLECFATKANGITAGNSEDLEIMTKLWFLFCMIWSICATVDEEGRLKIDAMIRERESCFPIKDTVYDYYVEVHYKTFVLWESKLSDTWKYDQNVPFYKIIVPTVDTIRYEYLVSKLLISESPVMLVGKVGTGKTSTAISVTNSSNRDTYSILSINISALTSPAGLQESIESRTEKRTKVLYVPIGGKKMILFMDDFNMPAKDTYGSQPPLELIRQWIDYKFWFDRKTQQRIYVQNTTLIAAMGPPGGGRQEISPRTLSRFFIINMTFPTEAITAHIFGTLLRQKLSDHESDVQNLWNPITLATIDLFNAVCKKLLPTPTKTHYLFNLRDISKIFQGLLRSDAKSTIKMATIQRLWIHECFRVFSDRLVDESDQSWFVSEINDTIGRHMDSTFHSLCPNKIVPIFGDFLSPQGFYEDIVNFESLRSYMISQLEEYNLVPGSVRVNIVFFREAIEHVVRIVRVISQQKGHMLHIGIGGSGRQVLARMATFICEYDVFKVEVTRKYRTPEFREDLKSLYKITGIKNRPCVFLFSGDQVMESAFLETINNMLSTCEANLFKTDEFEELKPGLERQAKKMGVQATTEAYYNLFMQNVCNNLHIIICLSPIGEDFRLFLRQYPGLINATTSNWFRMWPQEALLEVAQKSLLGVQLNVPIPGQNLSSSKDSLVHITEEILQENAARVFSFIHSSVVDFSNLMLIEMQRHNYVTSINFLELVSGFKDLLQSKRIEVSSNSNKLRNGLSKIEETQEKVAIMSEDLKVSQEQVKELTSQCEVFIAEIGVQSQEAEEQKEKVDEESKIISQEEVVCIELAEIAQQDLDFVMPMIDNAVKALDALNKKDLSEVKSYGKPPPKIEKVMEAVMILLGKEPTWEMAKKMLGEQSFLNDLRTFDRDHVSDKTLKRIGLYTQNPELEPEKVATVSSACKSLMLWIIAIENYAKVYRIMAPKKEKLDKTMQSLAEKQALLASARRKLEELNSKLERLRDDFKEKSELLENLKNKSEKLRKQLDRAIILVESLSGERQRWMDTVVLLDIDFEKLPGDCILATAFLSYLGPFDSKYRDGLLEKWQKQIQEKNIPHTEDFKIIRFLSDPVTIREWNIQGLPLDDFSTENGIIATQGRRWPLIIDPQNQANGWIRNLESRDLKTIDFNQPDYPRVLERAMQFGFPVLLQNVTETLDPIINPILSSTFTIQGGQKFIKFNDKFIYCKESFKLYITTKITNPHYPPETSSKTAIINFAVKQSALEAQLLGIIVRKEKPALEQQKDEMVMTIARNKRILIDLDNQILRLLNESRGSLLEDDELFNTLQKSRHTSALVKESLSTAEVTEIEIDIARQAYQPAAERASILFFVLTDLAKIDPMYQFSLAAYILLFIKSIERSPKQQVVKERISHINEYHTYAVFRNTCRGLFEKHKLLFSIAMCAKMLEAAGKLVETEYNFILNGGIIVNRLDQVPNPSPNWITEEMWDNVTELDKTAGFHGIINSFEQFPKLWHEWYSCTIPESEALVGEWNDKLNDFQKICVVRCLRSDRIIFCLSQFTATILGSKFVEAPILDLKSAFEESSADTPLIFLLSPGVDPTGGLISLAEQVNMSSKLFSLSLGQGQAPLATKLIMEGAKDGNWVFLANCHLSLSWLPSLDKIIQMIQATKVNKKFRLWLSSDPHKDFPVSILQTGIKMTTEPPRGIKANMKRLYNNISEENFNECTDPITYKKLIFALCFFHSVLIERRKFQQLGWNVIYSFNDSDFEVSEILLFLYINEYEETQWEALKYLIAGVNYGGHVTDEWDRRLLMTYINNFFTSDAITIPSYRLSSLRTYLIPPDGDLQYYKDHIELLPNTDRPEAFGQHPNADIASLIGETKDLLDALLSIQGQTYKASAESMDSKVLRLAQDIESNIPDEMNNIQTVKILGLNRSPLEVVLLQEMSRYNVLLANIKVCLRDLQNGIKGLVLMDSDLEDVLHAVFEGRVPNNWLKTYQSQKPLASWTRDLVHRVDYFNRWATTLKAPSLFWLSAYTFPTGYLTAVLQTSARASKTPIDELSWEFSVFVEDEAAVSRMVPSEGVCIRGLFLEGAGWNRKARCLQDPQPMELVCPMPVIHFKPVENTKKRSRGIYHCPTYYFAQRAGSFVTVVDLKSGSETSDYWIKRATSLLLSLSS